jgi:hypothetical protein
MKRGKWKKYLIIAGIAIVVIIIAIVGMRKIMNNNTKESSINKKINNELDYLGTTTLSMINSLNNLNLEDVVKVRQTSTNSGDNSQNNANSSSGDEGKNNSKTSDSQQQEDSSSNSKTDETSSTGTDTKNTKSFSLDDNSILLRDNTNVDWSALESEAENLFTAWSTIILDLNSLSISNEDILAYNSNLDSLLKALKDNDKANSAISLANLYSLNSKYINESSKNDESKKLAYIKSNVISAYSLVTAEKWEQVNQLLDQAEKGLLDVINTSGNTEERKQTKINKSYVMLKELIKTSNEKNAEIFYLKYINLIKELNNI